MPAGASRPGLSRTTRDKTARVARSTCRGWLRRRTVLDRTRAWGGKETHTGFCLCGRAEAARRVPRGRSEPAPGGGFFRLPAAGRWPLAQERRAAGARAHARPKW